MQGDQPLVRMLAGLGTHLVSLVGVGLFTGTPRPHRSQHEIVQQGRTRNFLLKDPILGWLELYGSKKGFWPGPAYFDYDPRTDFTEFIFRQAATFESAVITHLQTLKTIVTIGSDPSDIRDLGKGAQTFKVMQSGVPIICQGVL